MEAFDLYAPVIDADPFPYYAELRAKHPCYWSDNAQLWILSRYDDIVEAARELAKRMSNPKLHQHYIC